MQQRSLSELSTTAEHLQCQTLPELPRRPADRKVAKYQLMHSVRSHIGADDDAFNAIRQREDEDGIRGILLQRNVVPTAATALKTNIASLAPLVLPFTELVRTQLLFLMYHLYFLLTGLKASGV